MKSNALLCLPFVLAVFGVDGFGSEKASADFEVIEDYQSYIAGSGTVVVWYGERVALVLDEEPKPEKRNPETMKAIACALDDLFDAYDEVTGRQPKLTAPLNGKIRIEISSKVGGGLAHHGRLGVGIGDGFFEGLYERFDKGTRTVDQVFFYEIARNYWMADMNPSIDYHTSKGPQDYGWWTVGFNNAMSLFLPSQIDSIDDMYYFGSNGKQFSDGMEANLNAYLESPAKYNWDNAWNVPLVPWKERTSVNDLMTALLIRLHRDQGGIAFIRRLYEEIPKRKPLESRADRQGARDNFYEASSIAAGKDLYEFFAKELRWKISDERHEMVSSTLSVSTDNAPMTVPYEEKKTLAAIQWEVLDINFTAKDLPEQPLDVNFSATFTNDDGRALEVPGVFNGNGTFTVRFTPPTAGLWQFVTQSSLKGLAGKEGSLLATPARAGRKGGIVIESDSPTQFRYENGESYYPIAFESDWLFALDAENADDIPVTRKFVDQLAANGFNQVVMNVFAYDVKWKKDDNLAAKYDYGSPRVFPFGGDNEKPDHSQLNIEYFQRLDRVIHYLDQKGIAAHLMIYVWNKRVNWPAANSDADDRYFDYVVKRYQAFPNIVWDVSKEALGYGHTDVNYISERIKRLRDLDQFDRLVTVHDYSYCKRFTENVDFISVQLWLSELHSVMRKVRSEMPGKPILNIEHGGYEKSPYVVFNGNYTQPDVCLERAYQCVFAGTYPTHYWQGAAWNVIIPDIEALPREDQPRLDYYRHMRSFVDKYKVDRLIAGDKKSNAGFSLHNDKDLYVYYVPKECEFIGMRLPKDLRGGSMSGTWFDPFTGKYSEPVEKEIVQWPAFAKPAGAGFRILIVEIVD